MPASVPLSPPEQAQSSAPGLAVRMAGVLRSPRATFTALLERPRWIDVLAVTFFVTFACNAALLQTEVGRLALVDQWERTAIAFGQPVDEARYASFEQASNNGTVYAAFGAMMSGPVLVIGVAAALYLAFLRPLRGRASFVHLLAIVAHAGVILALRQVVATPVNYVRETLASPTTMNLFFTMLDEASPLARFFGVIDLFVVWWIGVVAIGVSVLTGRRTRPLALGFVGVYLMLALALTLLMAFAGGTA